jgi:protein-S-isoprenylcysteine O-methyltransferase Ste14
VRSLGVLIGVVGLAALVACFADFVAARGTPAPVAPTERLVVEGLYRYVRNPMYVAVVTIILGQALWHGSWWVAAYGVLVWVVTAAFTRFYEEPVLRARFGHDYETYRAAVRAWVPRTRPWTASEDPSQPG